MKPQKQNSWKNIFLSKGQSAVEFALCLPVMFGLCALGMDLGTTIVRYHRIATITKEAAQVGSQINDPQANFCPKKQPCYNIMKTLANNRVNAGLASDLGMNSQDANIKTSIKEECNAFEKNQICHLEVGVEVPTQAFFSPIFLALLNTANIEFPESIPFTSSSLTRFDSEEE